MKKLNIFLLFAILLVSCGPNVTAAPTSISTQIFTNTPTLAPTSTSIPTITPTPLPITFIYQDNVPADGRALQEQAANKAYAYYSQYADLGPITIYTFEDINLYIDQIFPTLHPDNPFQSKSSFVQEWIEGGGGNAAAKDIVVISSGFLDWNDPNSICYKAKNVSHEMFHLVQSNLLHYVFFRQTLDYGPEWIKEGSAEVFGYRIADGINGCTYQGHFDEWLEFSRNADFSLNQVEGGDIGKKAKFSSVAPLAVDYLINLVPNGEKSIIQYYSEIGDGKTWNEAFKSSFGMPVEDFYKIFQEYQDTLKITMDTSVCLPQSDSRIKCLGRKPNGSGYNYLFDIPFGFKAPPDQWTQESNCKLINSGWAGSTEAVIFQIFVGEGSTQGTCHAKFIYAPNQQFTIDFLVPYQEPEFDTSVCLSQNDTRFKCLGLAIINELPNHVFELYVDVTTPREQWKVTNQPECSIRVIGFDENSSTESKKLLFSASQRTHGLCKVKVQFTDSLTITFMMFVP